jgi:hypothetical protein
MTYIAVTDKEVFRHGDTFESGDQENAARDLVTEYSDTVQLK